jgi:predicted alpha/beta-fold hydrolase
MKDLAFEWSQNKHDRTFLSASTYLLTRVAYHIAPGRVSKLMREKGFRVKPFHLSEDQQALLQRAHSFNLEFNQNKIRVFEWGTGPVILLVHGWAGRALQLDSLISALLSKGYKVVAFDQKGHGESSSRFSSYPEIVRGTDLVSAHYGKALYGIVGHSIGSNAMFKVSETFAYKLKIAAISPTGDILNMLDDIRVKMGIYKKLLAHVVRLIEADSGLLLAELNKLDYKKIARHDVLLVHDKFDKINKVYASHEIHRNLHGSSLMQTEMLGHSRILGNQAVVDRVVAHFNAPQP